MPAGLREDANSGWQFRATDASLAVFLDGGARNTDSICAAVNPTPLKAQWPCDTVAEPGNRIVIQGKQGMTCHSLFRPKRLQPIAQHSSGRGLRSRDG